MTRIQFNGSTLQIGGKSLIIPSPPAQDDLLKIQIETTSVDQEITIPHLSGVYTYDYVVDYGDESVPVSVTTYNDTGTTHTYSTPGTYDIVIDGTCETFYVNNAGTMKDTIKKVLNWGDVGLKISKFRGCTNLNSLSDMINCNNGLVNVNTFYFSFSYCSSLTSIPADLFKYSINANNFYATFQGCASLTSIPTNLFRYNTSVSSFQSIFGSCTKLQLNPLTFYAVGEETTRFSGVTINFTSCFDRNLFTGVQGTAPDLWDCTFGGVTSSNAFGGFANGLSSISNYNDIPVAWGGTA